MPADHPRLKVLLAGSNYGQWYAQALAGAPEQFVLAGLLARGSLRSQELARRLGIPLYRETADLPADLDLACAALGRAAEPVIFRLLARGIHVLCEQPRNPAFLDAAQGHAAAGGTRFHVNAHFSRLPAAQRFAAGLAQLTDGGPGTLHLELTAADRFLFGALDVLQAALGELAPVRLEAAGRSGPFALLRGHLGDASVLMQVQCSLQPGGGLLPERHADYRASFRLAATGPHGTLSLLGPAGPVVQTAGETRLRLPGDRLWQEETGGQPLSLAELAGQRALANQEALEELAAAVAGRGAAPRQEAAVLKDLSLAWESVGALIAG